MGFYVLFNFTTKRFCLISRISIYLYSKLVFGCAQNIKTLISYVELLQIRTSNSKDNTVSLVKVYWFEILGSIFGKEKYFLISTMSKSALGSSHFLPSR